MEGIISKGYGRGSKNLGFPTSNLPQFHEKLETLQISNGVYCGLSLLKEESQPQLCVTNIGYAPTFVGKVYSSFYMFVTYFYIILFI